MLDFSKQDLKKLGLGRASKPKAVAPAKQPAMPQVARSVAEKPHPAAGRPAAEKPRAASATADQHAKSSRGGGRFFGAKPRSESAVAPQPAEPDYRSVVVPVSESERDKLWAPYEEAVREAKRAYRLRGPAPERYYRANPELYWEHQQELREEEAARRAKETQEYLDKLHAQQDLNGSRTIREMMNY